MATHSSTLAWKIPWMEEPGRLRSMGSLSWTQLSDFTFTFHFHALEKKIATHSTVLAWRIPGTVEPGGPRLQGRTELDMTEVIQQQQQQKVLIGYTLNWHLVFMSISNLLQILTLYFSFPLQKCGKQFYYSSFS